jgi:2-polyprenyl-3-methyl-5-hydroxy-6-metoxy-1,4-benzoquinol methylase
MPKKCIICNSKDNIRVFRRSSFLKHPTYTCSKCSLRYLFCNDDKIKQICNEYYERDYWTIFRKNDRKKYILNSIIKILRLLNTKPLLQTWHRSLIKKHGPNKGKKFLDIGCGKGQTLMYFSKMGFEVMGIEPDKNNSKKINSIFRKPVCINSSAESIKLREKFDIIYLCHVFEHLVKPNIFLEKIKKNLNRDGVIFLEVPNCKNKKMLDASIFKHPHIYHFSPKSMKKLFETHRYKIRKLGVFSEIHKDKLSMFFQMIFKLGNYKETQEVVGDKLIVVAEKEA